MPTSDPPCTGSPTAVVSALSSPWAPRCCLARALGKASARPAARAAARPATDPMEIGVKRLPRVRQPNPAARRTLSSNALRRMTSASEISGVRYPGAAQGLCKSDGVLRLQKEEPLWSPMLRACVSYWSAGPT